MFFLISTPVGREEKPYFRDYLGPNPPPHPRRQKVKKENTKIYTQTQTFWWEAVSSPHMVNLNTTGNRFSRLLTSQALVLVLFCTRPGRVQPKAARRGLGTVPLSHICRGERTKGARLEGLAVARMGFVEEQKSDTTNHGQLMPNPHPKGSFL